MLELTLLFEGTQTSFSKPEEILVGTSGVFVEYFSGLSVPDPEAWLSEKSTQYFLAGAIGYECAWDFHDVHFPRPDSDTIPDFIVGAFTKYSKDEEDFESSQERSKWTLTPSKKPCRSDHTQKVGSAIEAIYEGELFEVNITGHSEYDFEGNPRHLFDAMKETNQGNWFSWLRFDDLYILSSSPECFLRVKEGKVSTDPIKGTAKVGSAESIQSEKNRAENIMIVDLMRNDLTPFCVPGTVRATELYREEVIGDIVHLVSRVEGDLYEGCTPLDLLCGCFPPGSISGAPKLRAIEIAADLENRKRGFYCGTMFYSDPCGDLMSSVLIRSATLVHKDSKSDSYLLAYGVGGAVVSDSDPDGEYDEALLKLGPIETFL